MTRKKSSSKRAPFYRTRAFLATGALAATYFIGSGVAQAAPQNKPQITQQGPAHYDFKTTQQAQSREIFFLEPNGKRTELTKANARKLFGTRGNPGTITKKILDDVKKRASSGDKAAQNFTTQLEQHADKVTWQVDTNKGGLEVCLDTTPEGPKKLKGTCNQGDVYAPTTNGSRYFTNFGKIIIRQKRGAQTGLKVTYNFNLSSDISQDVARRAVRTHFINGSKKKNSLNNLTLGAGYNFSPVIKGGEGAQGGYPPKEEIQHMPLHGASVFAGKTLRRLSRGGYITVGPTFGFVYGEQKKDLGSVRLPIDEKSPDFVSQTNRKAFQQYFQVLGNFTLIYTTPGKHVQGRFGFDVGFGLGALNTTVKQMSQAYIGNNPVPNSQINWKTIDYKSQFRGNVNFAPIMGLRFPGAQICLDGKVSSLWGPTGKREYGGFIVSYCPMGEKKK